MVAIICAAPNWLRLLAFFLGVIPYPYGLIVLAALIAARILYLRGPRKPR